MMLAMVLMAVVTLNIGSDKSRASITVGVLRHICTIRATVTAVKKFLQSVAYREEAPAIG